MGQPSLQMSSAAFLRDRGREAGGLGFANGEKPPARQGRRGPRCSWYHPKNPKRLCLPITSRPRTTNLREIALKTKRARAGGRPAMMFPWVSRASRVPSVSHRTNPAPSRLPYCPAAATRLPPSVPRSFADSQTSDSKHRKQSHHIVTASFKVQESENLTKWHLGTAHHYRKSENRRASSQVLVYTGEGGGGQKKT
ncbi:uncharacterized protein LOC113987776 isoform X2 [Pipra filicauda]|uniref:Uncharacterized protein LOC113987776 isoform X2 n=1 Tax=Pipra filicauda TaxID=649802 RepID=A0A7R5KSX1_9PASS|nr:uncharacterized protein LOC113987776 isoform X2 [Pipra filicauda]